MPIPKPVILAFDLYGTLLSTSSIAKELSKHFGDDEAANIATTWRTLQLEYTWRLNSMHQFGSFSDVTRNSLNHALRTHAKSLDDEASQQLMKAYDSLSTFPDVPPALKAIDANPDIHAVVFSNGTNSMVTNSVNHSNDLSPHSSVFKEIVTVEQAGCFKPAPKVYEYLAEKVNKKGKPGDMWLISGNPFDVIGARSVGMQAAWVDREGKGWTDQLIQSDAGQPTIIVKGLDEVVDKVQAWHDQKG